MCRMVHSNSNRSVAIIGELADVLQAFRDLRCAPSIEVPDDRSNRGIREIVLTIAISPTSQDDVRGSMRVLELLSELEHAIGIMQLRALAERYGIPSEQLEALLPSGPPLSDTVVDAFLGRIAERMEVDDRARIERIRATFDKKSQAGD